MFPLQFIASLRAAIEASRSPRGPTLVAIDGPGCSGKTTLASTLEAAWGDDAISIGTDGFFIPFGEQQRQRNLAESLESGVPHLRWHELAQMIERLARGREGRYRPYDWETDKLLPEIGVAPRSFVIVEGLYALHRRLRDAYRYKIWIDSDRDDRMARVEARDGPLRIHLWDDIYVPRERSYMQQQQPAEQASVFVLGAGLAWSGTRTSFARQSS